MTRTIASWTRQPSNRPPPCPDCPRKRHTITLSEASSSLWCLSQCWLVAHTSRSAIDYCSECVTALPDVDDKGRRIRMWWWARSSIHRWFNLRSKPLAYYCSEPVPCLTLIITIICVVVIPNQLASKRRDYYTMGREQVSQSPYHQRLLFNLNQFRVPLHCFVNLLRTVNIIIIISLIRVSVFCSTQRYCISDVVSRAYHQCGWILYR